MLVSITDFASERGVDRDTVNAYLRKHPEIKEETRRDGKNVVIDTNSKAYELLDKQYPLPSPVEIVEDTESRKQMIQAQQLIIQLQQQIVDMQQQLLHSAEIEARAAATQTLLEDKDALLERRAETIDRLDEELEAAKQETKNAYALIDMERQSYNELREKYYDECSRTWLDKLLHRKKGE